MISGSVLSFLGQVFREMTTMKTFATLLLFALTGTLLQVHAQSQKTDHTLSLDEGQSSPKASIEEVAWIAGDWVGQAFGGTVEEIWRSPAAGAMMGMFRLAQEDKIGFYELMIIREEEGSLTYNLKHFNPDLTGWEEKNETVKYPLVAIQGQMAFFDGITFQRGDEQTLNIYLASKNKPGGFDELVFNFKKENP